MDFSRILGSDETLFRNIEVFNPDYIPDQFLFRDSQVKEMIHCLRPAMQNGRPASAFIVGRPATGKTTAARLVMKQLAESTSKVVPVYINCHLQSSQFKILSEIRKAVMGMPAPDTGIPLTRVQDEVFGRLANDGKVLAVCLDEAGYLFSSGIANESMYNILRAHESYPGVKTCIFAISTQEFVHKLDDKVRSIFSPVRIEFSPYSTTEVFSILKGRCDAGLYPGVLQEKLLRKMASNVRDLRFGIELLRQSVMAAESDASRSVRDTHIEKAMGSMEVPETSSDKSLVLSIIRKHGPIESGKLFSMVQEQSGASYSGFYRMLKKLEAGNFIEIEQSVSSKSRGRTSIISAK